MKGWGPLYSGLKPIKEMFREGNTSGDVSPRQKSGEEPLETQAYKITRIAPTFDNDEEILAGSELPPVHE